MAHKLKALCLAAFAVFAVSAVAATAAQAENFFHNHIGEVNPDQVIITGEGGEDVFRPGPEGPEVICSKTVVEGTEDTEGRTSDVNEKAFTHNNNGTKTITSTSITLTPTYSGCKLGNLNAVVDTDGCHYRFTAETVGEHGRVHVECEAGKEILVTVPELGVTLTIPTQTPTGGGVHYTNVGGTSDGDIKAKATVTGISYTCKPALLCALGGVASSGTDGTYTTGKEVTVKAFEDLNTPENTNKTGVYEEGKQLGAWWGPTI